MDISIEREDILTVLAALLLALEAHPRGMVAKDRDAIKRIAKDIAQQAEDADASLGDLTAFFPQP